MDHVQHDTFPGLRLEDSFILGWKQGVDLTFKVEFCLSDSHAAYVKPKPGEWACFVLGILVFPRVRSVVGLPSMEQARSSIDKTGEHDYGEIEVLDIYVDRSVLQSSIGQFEIISEPPIVSIDGPA